jgi:hypothetical protein
MTSRFPVLRALVAAVAAILLAGTLPALAQTKGSGPDKASPLEFGGKAYVHRWSKNGQNEFTQPNDSDLARWRDMITINTHEAVRNGDQLADLANRVLGTYQSHGKIVRTDSKPRTAQRSAEHLVVAVLGNPSFLEAAFARFVLIDGVGTVAVYSHRVYGKEAGPAMTDWLQANAQSIEKTPMAWDRIPTSVAPKQLPQSP